MYVVARTVKTTIVPTLPVGKPGHFVSAILSEFDKGTSVIESLNHRDFLADQGWLSIFRHLLPLAEHLHSYFSAGFSTGGTVGFPAGSSVVFFSGGVVGLAGSDFLQPPNTKAAIARVTSIERTIFLMILPFQNVFRTVLSANVRAY